MKRRHAQGFRRPSGRSLATLLATALLVAPLAACDWLDRALSTDAPSRIPADPLEVPANAELLVTGAIADFDCALGVAIVMSGLVGEELEDATLTADRWPYDQRNVLPSARRYAVNECDELGVYTPLNRARASADRILGFLEGWTNEEVANRDSLIATAATYAGYSRVLLGELFCTAAISSLDENLEIVYGPEISREEVFAQAEERFTRAIEAAGASGSTEILNTALVGRARTRLNLGRVAEAAADAALVPPDFVKAATASVADARRENRVFDQNNATTQNTSVGPRYQSLTVDGVPDPRVPVINTGDASTTGIPIWVQEKYASFDAELPIATYDEAQLIIAEAEVAAGNLPNAVNIINTFRARAGLPAFAGGDAATVQATIIEERRRELFLEGHHLGDIIRYGLTPEPVAGTPYRNGGEYGTTTCLPLPDVERLNNPTIGG